MAMFVAMSIAVKETIDTLGVENLHAVSGIPRRTLYRWRKKDRIPGNGPRYEWTVRQFQDAVAKARKAAKPRRQRKAA